MFMDSETFLSGKSPRATGIARWAGGKIVLEVSSYIGTALPPGDLVTSVRGVIVEAGRVVVLRNRDGRHYLPGGRIKSGETYLEALTREIDEECGLELTDAEYIGFIHFRHRTPKPERYPYPYPDMYHLIYMVGAAGDIRSGDPDGYEEEARFVAVEEAKRIEGMAFAIPFLKRATGI